MLYSLPWWATGLECRLYISVISSGSNVVRCFQLTIFANKDPSYVQWAEKVPELLFRAFLSSVVLHPDRSFWKLEDSLHSWRDFGCECICFGCEAMNASGKAVRWNMAAPPLLTRSCSPPAMQPSLKILWLLCIMMLLTENDFVSQQKIPKLVAQMSSI